MTLSKTLSSQIQHMKGDINNGTFYQLLRNLLSHNQEEGLYTAETHISVCFKNEYRIRADPKAPLT